MGAGLRIGPLCVWGDGGGTRNGPDARMPVRTVRLRTPQSRAAHLWGLPADSWKRATPTLPPAGLILRNRGSRSQSGTGGARRCRGRPTPPRPGECGVDLLSETHSGRQGYAVRMIWHPVRSEPKPFHSDSLRYARHDRRSRYQTVNVKSGLTEPE